MHIRKLLRLPPWGLSGTEIGLSPWFQDNLVVGVCLHVSKGK